MVYFKVDFSIEPVQKNFLGNNAVYHGYAGMPDRDGRVYSAELCELEADRVATLGLRMARTFYKWYAWDPKTNTWDWESERSLAFQKWLTRMKNRGLEVSLNMGWWLPHDILSGGPNVISPFTVEGDWDTSVSNFAAWVSEELHQLIEVRGFTNITSITLFTEPQRGSAEFSQKDQYHYYLDMLKAVDSRLKTDGRRHLVKIVGPNEGSTCTHIMTHWMVENAADYIDVFSSHDYQDFLPFEEFVEENPKEHALRLSRAGARMQKLIALKQHTEYEMSVKFKVETCDQIAENNHIIFGAFDMVRGEAFGLISAGEQETSSLNPDSVKTVSAKELGYGIHTVTHKFCSKTEKECKIGVFSDIKQKNAFLKVFEVSITELNSGDNENWNFTFENSPLVYRFNDNMQYTKNKWRGMDCYRTAISDPYYFIVDCVNLAKEKLPKSHPYWFDEYNVRVERNRYNSEWHGTHRAALMQALMNAGVENSFMWTLFDQQWPNSHATNDDAFVDGEHRYGVMPTLTRSLVPYPVYYSAGLIMRYMGGGTGTKIYALEGKDFVHGTLSKMPDGNISLLVINNKSTKEEITVDFNTDLNLKLYRHIYSPETIKPDITAELPGCDKEISVLNSFSDILPPGSVSIYTTITE